MGDDTVPGPTDGLVERLVDELGETTVVDDRDVRAAYETDWTGRYGGPAIAVLRPTSTDEVAAALRTCSRLGVAVVTQGGNTGLVGGGVPRPGRDVVVLSTERLDHVGPPDSSAMQVTCGAGATIGDWAGRAREVGLDAPVDFAARDTATIGGAIATNAGGSRVVRFGTMRQQVVGVEAVLIDGTVVGSLDGLPKETAGLHWPSLLAGSEGTLAVVTAARLRLVPWYRRRVTAMSAMDTIDDAVTLLARLRADVHSLDQVEVVLGAAMGLVCDHLGVTPPVRAEPDGAVVIVECAAHDDPTDELLAVLGDADGCGDTAVAVDPAPRRSLLDVRDRMTEAIAAESTALGVPTFKLDVAVPVGRLDELLRVAHDAAEEDGCRLVAFGHLAEGNLHLNHLGATDPERIAGRVLPAVAALGGTISAEHGIGVAKAPYLRLIRSPGDLAAQRAIRRALDPDGLLNPGVLS